MHIGKGYMRHTVVKPGDEGDHDDVVQLGRLEPQQPTRDSLKKKLNRKILLIRF